MSQQSANLQLFGLNSLTGIEFTKPLILNQTPTVNGTGLVLQGDSSIQNILYTTGNQNIAGNKTFSNNIVFNNSASSPNQTLENPGALINSNLLISLLQNTSIGLYARQGTNTGSNNQYAVQGTIGFSATPVAGSSAMYIQYYFDKQGLVHNTAITSAGGGSQIKYDRPFILSFGFTTPSSPNAQDVDIRLLYGPATVGGVNNARVVSIGSTNFGGVGLKITKHPTNNTYLTRMFSRPFALNNPVNITNCSNTSPIVVSTQVPHNMVTGDMVEITGVTGNTAANGEWNIVKIDNNNFSLTNSVGNGTYTTSGTIVKLTTSSLELTPNYYYRAYFKWNPLTSVVTLHLGDHNAPASLSVSLPSAAASTMVSHQTGHVFTAGIASINYSAGFLGMTVSPPSMYQSF